jgi:ribosomal-protein-alanine N-acetyltransferase
MSDGASVAAALNVRWMLRRDMDAVMRIERAAFEFPWSETDFVRVLRNRSCIGMVAAERFEGGEVYGFMIYELFARRIGLLNMAVEPCRLRGGVGRMMIEKLAAKLSPRRRRRITAEVGERNLAAQLFFRAMGFRAEAIVHVPWPQTPNDDAYLFVYQGGLLDELRKNN